MPKPMAQTREICLMCANAICESSNFSCAKDRPEFWNNPQGYEEVAKDGMTLPGAVCPKFKESKI